MRNKIQILLNKSKNKSKFFMHNLKKSHKNYIDKVLFKKILKITFTPLKTN